MLLLNRSSHNTDPGNALSGHTTHVKLDVNVKVDTKYHFYILYR